VKLGLKALHSQRKIQENQEVIVAIKEGLHNRWEIWFFSFYYIYCFMTVDFRDLWTTCLFWICEYYFSNNFKFHEFKLPKSEYVDGRHKEVCFS
jgi:hypothetical protein